MVLSVNAAVDAVVVNEFDNENESPLGRGGGGGKQPVLSPSKRKSELISPSASRWRRGDRGGGCDTAALFSSSTDNDAPHARIPLSDVNSKAPVSVSSTTLPTTPSTPSSKKPPTPARAKFNSNVFKQPHHLHTCPSKEEVEATDEKRSSVNQLSEWLALESAKKKKKKKPPPCNTATPPISFHTKPRIKKCDVEATDSKRVSVKTLGAWMSDDPFEQRKVRTIRSSHKIIAKSRVFEKNDASIKKLAKENDIRAGSVTERRDWLSRDAFKHENGEEMPQALREKKLRPYQCKPKQKETPEKELKSVRDKKEWLSKAFKKGVDEGQLQQGIREINSFEAQQQQHGRCAPGGSGNATSGTPKIHPTKSFEANCNNNICTSTPAKTTAAATKNTAPGIVKCASADQYAVEHGSGSNTVIRQAKSYDCGTTTVAANAVGVQGKLRPPPERQPSVVRLYRRDSSKLEDEGDGESPEEAEVEETPSPKKSVHDRQAWLSSAFKKKKDQEKSDCEEAAAVTEPAEEQKGAKIRITNPGTRKRNKNETNRANNCVGCGQKDDDGGDGLKEIMSVADRAAWLKGAFKGK